MQNVDEALFPSDTGVLTAVCSILCPRCVANKCKFKQQACEEHSFLIAGFVKQSANEVHLHRHRSVSQIETFEVCGFGDPQWQLRIFKDGNRFATVKRIFHNSVPVFDMHAKRTGVAAMLWDTNNTECRLLVVRVWPSIVSGNFQNVSVELYYQRTTGLTSFTYSGHKIDFIFHDNAAETERAIIRSEGK